MDSINETYIDSLKLIIHSQDSLYQGIYGKVQELKTADSTNQIIMVESKKNYAKKDSLDQEEIKTLKKQVKDSDRKSWVEIALEFISSVLGTYLGYTLNKE